MGSAYRDRDSEGRMMETGKIIEMLIAYTPMSGDNINKAAEIAKQAADLLRRPIEVYHTAVYSLIIPPQTTPDELATLVKVALRVPQ